MARLVQVVRFVDDGKRRQARPTQRVAMKLEELRRREHEVPRAVAQRSEEFLPLVVLDRAVRAKATQAERIERAPQRFVLIVRKRAQRIDDERLAGAGEGAQRRGELKTERFSAPGAQHRERVLAGVEALEHGALRLVRRRVADQRAANALGDRIQIAATLSARRIGAARGRTVGFALDQDVDAAKPLLISLC